jgi:hypothetical protein
MKPALLQRSVAGPRTQLLLQTPLRPAVSSHGSRERSRHFVNVEYSKASQQVRAVSTAAPNGGCKLTAAHLLLLLLLLLLFLLLLLLLLLFLLQLHALSLEY